MHLILAKKIFRLLSLLALLFLCNGVSVPTDGADIVVVKNHAQSFPVSMALATNDPDRVKQQYLDQVRALSAWDIVRERSEQRSVTIAVLDTGVDINHPDLFSSIWKNEKEIPGDGIDNDENSYIDDVNGWDFLQSIPDPRPKLDSGYAYDAVNHGTIVAGIIAAQSDNTIGIAGAAYRAKIMPLRVLDSTGAGNTLLLAQAIDYAVENGADVINLSLVGDVSDPHLAESIARAYASGVAVVAASGNQEHAGVNLNLSPRYPICEAANANKVIGVAAVDEQNILAPFSNYGSNCIDIAAPGTNMYSTVFHQDGNPTFDKYFAGGWNGTSLAAPLVSSALGLIQMVAPNLSSAEQYRALLTSAKKIQAAGTISSSLGSGILDMTAALEAALSLSREKPLSIALAQGKGFEPKVIVKNKEGVTQAEFLAYAPRFYGGLTAVFGDIDGDAKQEIITAPLSAGGPHIRIFDTAGKLKGQFMAFDTRFKGGLSVATGDMNGDGIDEIIVVPLNGGVPRVRIFNAHGALLSEFDAYAPQFRGGVRLAVGDLDSDGKAELVTAPASLGGPHIRVFDAHGNVRGQFMAFDPAYRGGLNIGIGDLDGDGHQDLAAVQESDHDVQVRIVDGSLKEKNRFLLYPEIDNVEYPTALLLGDYSGDGQDDLITYPLTPGGSLKVFDYYGRVLESIDPTRLNADERSVRFSFSIFR